MKLKRQYCAFLSVPISASSDSDAWRQADRYARRLRHPGSTCIARHTEMVFQEEEGRGRARRVVYRDPGFGVPRSPTTRPDGPRRGDRVIGPKGRHGSLHQLSPTEEAREMPMHRMNLRR